MLKGFLFFLKIVSVRELKLIPVQRTAFASSRRTLSVCVCVRVFLPVREPTSKNELSHAWKKSLCVLFHVKARESWSDAKVTSAREAACSTTE